jgi:hypothetical protein
MIFFERARQIALLSSARSIQRRHLCSLLCKYALYQAHATQ